MRKNKNRMGNPIDIGRLDFHDFWGRLQDRTRWKMNEKEKAVMAIDKIRDRSSLTASEEESIRNGIREKSKKEMHDMISQAKRKPFSSSGFKKIR